LLAAPGCAPAAAAGAAQVRLAGGADGYQRDGHGHAAHANVPFRVDAAAP
jgi:hypothetical protein